MKFTSVIAGVVVVVIGISLFMTNAEETKPAETNPAETKFAENVDNTPRSGSVVRPAEVVRDRKAVARDEPRDAKAHAAETLVKLEIADKATADVDTVSVTRDVEDDSPLDLSGIVAQPPSPHDAEPESAATEVPPHRLPTPAEAEWLLKLIDLHAGKAGQVEADKSSETATAE